jgi:hypothetical protein
MLVLTTDGRQVEVSLGKTFNFMEARTKRVSKEIKASLDGAFSGFTSANAKAMEKIAREMSSGNLRNLRAMSQAAEGHFAAMERGARESTRRAQAAALREVQKGGREQVRASERTGRDMAAQYERNVGPGFFWRLASRASSAFKSAFNVGGAGRGGGGGDGGGGLLGGAMSVLTGNILTTVLGGITSKITGGVKAGFDYNKIKEQTLLGFEIKLKGRKEAEAFFRQIEAFAAEAPQELGQVLESTQRLMSAFKPREALFALGAITDAVAFQGKVGGEAQESINGIGTALQQVLFKNRLYAEEMIQLSERQVNGYKYLAAEMSKTDKSFAALTDEEKQGRVIEMASKGMLNARTAVAVILRGMQEEFGGAASRIARETAAGMESNISDSLNRTAGIASESAFERYKQFLDKTNTFLKGGASERIAGGISAGTGAIFDGIEGTLDALRSGNIQKLGLDAMSSAASGIQSGARGLYDAATGAAGQLEQGWRDRLDQHSPSKVLLNLGFEAGDSLVSGFESAVMRVGRVLEEIYGKLSQGKRGRALINPEQLDALVREAAARFGIDENLIRAIIKQESSGRVGAVSHKGARGLMQLMPATARRFGVTDIHDPRQNIMGGSEYLRFLLDRFRGDVRLALAGYNAGEGAVDKYRGIPPYRETQDYVQKIMRNYTRMATGVDAPAPTTAANLQSVGASQDVARRVAALEAQLQELNVERLGRAERIQLDLHRAGRESAFVRRELAKPENSATGANIINRRDLLNRGRELDVIMRDLTDEYHTFINDVHARIRDVTAQIEAARGRVASEAVARVAADGGSFKPGVRLDPAKHAMDMMNRARGGMVTTELGVLTGQVIPQALESVKLVASETAAAFENLPPLIKQTGDEARKQTEAIAKDLTGMLGSALESTLRGKWRDALKGMGSDFLNWTVGLAKEWFESRIFKALTGGQQDAAGGGARGGGILDTIKGLFGGGGGAQGTPPFVPDSSGGGGIGNIINGFRQGGVSGGFRSLLGLGGGASSSAAAAGGMPVSGITSAGLMATLGVGSTAAAGALPISGITSAGLMSTLGGGGAAAGSATGGGMMASMGALFTNPWTAVAAGAILGGVALWRHFRNGTEKKLRGVIQSEYGVAVKDMATLKQVKEIGEQAFGKGNVKKHLLETIRLEQSKELISAYAEQTGQRSSKLVLNRELQDASHPLNNFVAREFGGPARKGVAHLVGERRAEVFVPGENGHIYPSVQDALLRSISRSAPFAFARRRLAEELRARQQSASGGGGQSSPRPAGTGGSGAPGPSVAGAITMLTEAVADLKAKLKSMSPGEVLAVGAEQNPEAVGNANAVALRSGGVRSKQQEALGLRNA